jgi:seryl-tRNA synthetase
LNQEKEALEKGKKNQNDTLEKAKDQNDIDDANYLLEGVKNYEAEIADLENDINALANDRLECFGEFDEDVPSSVKVERNKRNAALHGKKKVEPPTSSDKPEDMYYKIHVNTKYKQRIHELLKNLR